MKYKYTPNCRIIDYRRNKEMFRFNGNGEFETEDSELIEWIRKNKNFLKPDPKYKCKKCDYETDNMGELLAHYKHEHKGDE